MWALVANPYTHRGPPKTQPVNGLHRSKKADHYSVILLYIRLFDLVLYIYIHNTFPNETQPPADGCLELLLPMLDQPGSSLNKHHRRKEITESRGSKSEELLCLTTRSSTQKSLTPQGRHQRVVLPSDAAGSSTEIWSSMLVVRPRRPSLSFGLSWACTHAQWNKAEKSN